MNAARFRQAMRLYASGVCVVASGTGDLRRGMTVSAVSSVSAEPPMILVCLNRSAGSHGAITSAERFSVNILDAADEQVALAFAGQTGLSGDDRFAVGDWRCAGAPVLGSALRTLLCAPVARHDAGSHTILIGKVIEVSGSGTGQPMVNFDGALRSIPASAAA